MAEQEISAEEQLSNAVWTWVQRLVVAAVLFGSGYFAHYYRFSDAADLRLSNKQLQDQVVDLKNQRETMSTRLARESRDKEVCRRDLKKCKAGE